MKVQVAILCSAVAISGGAAVSAHAAERTFKMEDTTVQDSSMFIDPGRAAKVPVVLRVRLLNAVGSDKFQWDRVDVIAVIKNESKRQFGGPLEVARYNWEPGVPKGESTIYLEPYSDAPEHPWKLLGASGRLGVSHVNSAAQ